MMMWWNVPLQRLELAEDAEQRMMEGVAAANARAEAAAIKVRMQVPCRPAAVNISLWTPMFSCDMHMYKHQIHLMANVAKLINSRLSYFLVSYVACTLTVLLSLMHADSTSA
jgi:hypothetical protein